MGACRGRFDPRPREHAQTSVGGHTRGGLELYVRTVTGRRSSGRGIDDGTHDSHQWDARRVDVLRAGAYRLRYFVHFTDADVIHTGDTWWNGVYPFIDYSTGGSIDGTIRAANSNIDKTTAKTVIIPGHGPVGDRSSLIEFRDMLVSIRAKIAALKQQGKSLTDVLNATPTAAYDAKWGSLVAPRLFTRLVYVGV
jgi:hypothetical protein